MTLGDPAGIGPEVVAKAWKQRDEAGPPPFVAVGDPAALRAVWSGPLAEVEGPEAGLSAGSAALAVIPVPNDGPVTPGAPTPSGAASALRSLELATGLVRAGRGSALVTAPVAKAGLYAVGFRQPGQTEWLAERCGVAADEAVMMLAGPGLRAVPVTIHLPLADVPAALSTALILSRARVTLAALARDFGIERPRLAVAGLNPHAGEGGALGREDDAVVAPAVAALRAEGHDVRGPLPADTMFHERARAEYDAALCMYHDQALIPVKALHFDEGVNVTLGLPVVRTSPDHGTAFAIAGVGRAEPGAMIAAIRMAGEIAARRRASAVLHPPGVFQQGP